MWDIRLISSDAFGKGVVDGMEQNRVSEIVSQAKEERTGETGERAAEEAVKGTAEGTTQAAERRDAEEPAGRAAEEAAWKATEETAGRTTRENTEATARKMAEEPIERATGETAGKTAAKRAAEEAAWKAAEGTAGRTTRENTETTVRKTAEDPVERPMGEAAEKTARKTVKETAERPMGETTEKLSRKMAEEPADRATEKTVEKTARKKRRDGKKGSWVRRGILVSAALAVVMICMYDLFRDGAEAYKSSPLENYSNISWLYRNCYLLYKDLYNAQAEEQKDYKELYLQPREEFEWILSADAWDESYAAFSERSASVEQEFGSEDRFYSLQSAVTSVDSFFGELESDFSALNSSYDYVIRDNKSGFYLSNMSAGELERGISNKYFQVSFEFNEYGAVTVGNEVAGVDEALLRKLASQAIRSNSMSDYVGTEFAKYLARCCDIKGPVDCTVTYCIPREDWESGQEQLLWMVSTGELMHYYDITYYNTQTLNTEFYRFTNMGDFLAALLFIALLAGLFLPMTGKPWREVKICSLPLEPLLAIGVVVFAGLEGIFDLVVYTASGAMGKTLYSWLGDHDFADICAFLINLVCLTAFFFCGWYLGVCARAVRDFGVKEYIRQRCIFYRIFPFIKSRALGFYDAVRHFDVTRNAHKMILKLVLINAALVFVISCFWVTGAAITVVYSVLLYVLLRKYISDLQKQYGLLLHATNEIAEGNLNVVITENLGVFEPFKPQIIRIQNGFRNAVEEEVRSQRMKAELITNVSHDLKTPLTAIITYINLLKEEGVTEEQRREYLDTLERKSLRLKVLIEDLFEVSKASSQTITLNIMDVDIMNLVKQVSFEMTDKLAASDLDVRMNLTDEKIILPLDSQKTYRIYENLLGNVAKYALPGTRVYINGFRIDDTVILTMKNISAQEITVDVAELTERFVRGDASRNTEGSGLGLAIAKSFVELQGGELSLEVDGDLFKVTTTWHV